MRIGMTSTRTGMETKSGAVVGAKSRLRSGARPSGLSLSTPDGLRDLRSAFRPAAETDIEAEVEAILYGVANE